MQLINTTELGASQRSAEWHAARVGRITASSVGAILGLAPYASREDVLRRMVRQWHGAPSEFEGNIATEWGTNHESLAILDYRLETGNDVRPCGLFVADLVLEPDATTIPIGATPDGLVGDLGLLEVKCPFGLRNDPKPAFKTAAEQPHYLAQMQFQMLLTGATETHFWQWTHHGHKLEIVPADRDWINGVAPHLAAFWREYLAAVADPEQHLEPARKVVDTPEASRIMAEYDECLEQIDRAEERKAELLQKLIAMADNRDALIAGRKVTKVEKAGAVAYAKALKALLPTVTDAQLAPYRGKPSVSWKVT